MKEGDLVRHYAEQHNYGIITNITLCQEQIAGIVTKRNLYTVQFCRGGRQVGLKFWELEVISENRRPRKV